MSSTTLLDTTSWLSSSSSGLHGLENNALYSSIWEELYFNTYLESRAAYAHSKAWYFANCISKLNLDLTLFRSITMFSVYVWGIFRKILSVPQNNVMDLNNVMKDSTWNHNVLYQYVCMKFGILCLIGWVLPASTRCKGIDACECTSQPSNV